MILSVSRRTDIPAFYSDWFFNRLKEGFLYVRNPMYPEKVSKISLEKEVIDCIVFWTKNAKPMLNRLVELDGYNYYFQYTINAYGPEIEPVAGRMTDESIEAFQTISKQIGLSRVIWRYDPIFFNEIYTKDFHIKTFREIAGKLKGYTTKVIISFLDLYGQTERNMPTVETFQEDKFRELVKELVAIAYENGMCVESCAEKIDLSREGVEHSCCIDKNLIEKTVGYPLIGGKDKGQRAECGCMESIDIGLYNTCKNQCKYCYANYGIDEVARHSKKYNIDSALLCDEVRPGDVITERKMKSLRRKR
ncbi:DUF1848 domain-containing protein [Lacrimispora amygdalina]|uniref:DUF1848 domain-containing protein n=1 Tax=Lacrimispora amygdalina TaxID=253257 RepID=UPI000BE3FA8F|nr:DUF1848 domain-containing protein [Lacrimispora amygdalina]